MKILLSALALVLLLAGGATAQTARPGSPGLIRGGLEAGFDWCPYYSMATGPGATYRICPKLVATGQILEKYCTYGQRDTTGEVTGIPGAFFGKIRAPACQRFVGVYQVCFRDPEEECLWSKDSPEQAKLPDLDGDGEVGLSDFAILTSEWGHPYGIQDFGCLSIWWGHRVPEEPELPALACPAN